jgi:hypothetical protein|nr:MAG TPA: hypothetical protein [Caudoviricetes sp.]
MVQKKKKTKVHIQQNQQHPQRKDKSAVDAVGNKRFRLFFKSGGASILVAKGLTKNEVYILTKQFENNLKNYDSKLEGVWLSVK